MKNLAGDIATAWSPSFDALGSVVNARLLVTDSTNLGEFSSEKIKEKMIKQRLVQHK